jgi:hypothetical protein
MTYPQNQPGTWADPQQGGGWADPASGAGYGYVDPVTGQPAYPTSPSGPPVYPQQPYAQQGYQQQAYAGYPAYGPPMAPTPGTNGMAIASLVLSLCGLASCGLTGVVGAILGHVARRQIRQRGEDGDGLALAGIISGWIIFALSVVGITAYVIFFVWLVHSTSNLPSDYPTY